MEEKKEVKYYRVRSSLFWTIIAIAITLLFLLMTGKSNKAKEVPHESQSQRVETEHMEYGFVKSKLKNTDECYLCGNAARSLMGYYRKFDTIGVIGLNEWYVLDLGLKKYDGKGNIESDQGGTSILSGNSQGVRYDIDSTPSRGMASATVTSTNGMFDKNIIQNNLCQSCLDKITDTLEVHIPDNQCSRPRRTVHCSA